MAADVGVELWRWILLVGVLEGPIVMGDWEGMAREEDGRGGVLVVWEVLGLDVLRWVGVDWGLEEASLSVRLAIGVLPGMVCRKVNGGFDVLLSNLVPERDGVTLSAAKISLSDVLVPFEATCHGEPDFMSSACGSTTGETLTSGDCCSATCCCCRLRSRCVNLLILLELGAKDERPVDMLDV